MSLENDELLLNKLNSDGSFLTIYRQFLNDGYGKTPGIPKDMGVDCRRLFLELNKNQPDHLLIKKQVQSLLDRLGKYLPADDNNRRSSHYTLYPIMLDQSLRRVVTESGVTDITFPEYTGKDLPFPVSSDHDLRGGVQRVDPKDKGNDKGAGKQ